MKIKPRLWTFYCNISTDLCLMDLSAGPKHLSMLAICRYWYWRLYQPINENEKESRNGRNALQPCWVWCCSLQLPCWQHHRCNDIDWFSFKLLFSNQNPEKACVCWASSVMQTNRLNVVNCPVIMSVFQNYYFSLTVIVVYLEYH